MDYNKFARIGSDNYNSAQTRSDTFYLQSGRSQKDEVRSDWVEFLKTQNVSNSQEKFAWKPKAPLPEIGESSPRNDVTAKIDSRNSLKSVSFHADMSTNNNKDHEEYFKKHIPPRYNYHKTNSSIESTKGLLTRSMDVFPSQILPKKTRLRPLAMDHLTVVPEARGASAFHHLPRMAPEIPTRPQAPVPLQPIEYKEIRKVSPIEIPGYIIPKRSNTDSPICPTSSPVITNEVLNVINNNNSDNSIPKLDLHKLQDTPEQGLKSNTFNHNMDNNGSENIKPREFINSENTPRRRIRPQSARKRRSVPFVVPVVGQDKCTTTGKISQDKCTTTGKMSQDNCTTDKMADNNDYQNANVL